MADLISMLSAAAGSGGGGLNIQEVFSIDLYTGTGSDQVITNDIDLTGEGGLVWIKNRTNDNSNWLLDSERSNFASRLITNGTQSQNTDAGGYVIASSTGFTTKGNDNNVGGSGFNYVAWTFRKAPKFFDVVTYTGNGVAGRDISHNLGSVPGCIIVKSISAGGAWWVYHRGMTSYNYNMRLNDTSGEATTYDAFGATPTSTVFNVDGTGSTNENGTTYVAYLFAHDDGGFGAGSTENVITCGSYTGNGSATGPTVTLGYEPQWLMIKRSDSTGDWIILDSKRDVSNPRDAYLEPNTSDAEATGNDVDFNSTSFQLKTTSATVNASGGTYIYVAIRADML